MINNRIRTVLREIVPEESVHYGCSLKEYTSFKIGGPADALITVNSIGQLERLLYISRNEDIPFFVIGKGTNLLIDDKGYRGFVIRLGDRFKEISIAGSYVNVGAGILMAKMVFTAARDNLGGIEHLAVIPGTVGGGITQNAGSSKKEIKTHLDSVEVLDIDQGVKRMTKGELRMSYRSSIFKDKAKKNIILSARLTLEPREFLTVKEDIKERLIKRTGKLPLKFYNAGSIFKIPSNGIPPGKLIEEAGCKGLCVGDAEVSHKHANFIVNKGNAKFGEILELIDSVRQRVMAASGTELELEVEVIH